MTDAGWEAVGGDRAASERDWECACVCARSRRLICAAGIDAAFTTQSTHAHPRSPRRVNPQPTHPSVPRPRGIDIRVLYTTPLNNNKVQNAHHRHSSSSTRHPISLSFSRSLPELSSSLVSLCLLTTHHQQHATPISTFLCVCQQFLLLYISPSLLLLLTS